MYLKFLQNLRCLGWFKTSEAARREENKVVLAKRAAVKPRAERLIILSRASIAWAARGLSGMQSRLGHPYLKIYISHFRLVSASSVTSRSIGISGSWSTIVFHSSSRPDILFIVCVAANKLDYATLILGTPL